MPLNAIDVSGHELTKHGFGCQNRPGRISWRSSFSESLSFEIIEDQDFSELVGDG
jgi:hypothetical protein